MIDGPISVTDEGWPRSSIPELENGPIFIVGCPRSGTTLLQQILSAHSQIAIAPETHFIRRFWLRRSAFGDLTRDSHFHRLLNEICSMPEFGEMDLEPSEFQRAAWLIPRSHQALFALLLSQFGRRAGASHVGEKTPNHLLYMDTLQVFFPAARFVHIVRDPRAVVASWRKVPWSTGTVIGDALVWRRYETTAHRQAAVVDRLFSLHYEALVTDPEPSIRALCEFLGVNFEAGTLSARDPRYGLNTEREPWKARAVEAITPERTSRWKHSLSPAMIAQIESITKLEMRRFGYRTETSGLPLLYWSAVTGLVRGFRRTQRLARRLIR